MIEQICKLTGKVQHYAWGGFEFIPQLINQPNIDNKPCAEYWLGAHPSASSVIEMADGKSLSLHNAIQGSPLKYIGQEVYNLYGGLPYLLKVLDVRDMLSIQVHPSKKEAEIGFAREDAAGIPLNAAYRNYKDRNHKPEVMVALSEFWLLHGFKKESLIDKILQDYDVFLPLQKMFKKGDYKSLYQFVMEMPQSEADDILRPIVKEAIKKNWNRNEPEFWVSKLYNNDVPASNYDRGIFSLYFFNIVNLQPGQAIFQDAGVPHAYLQGQNIELMANSDNVLRGGLTPKHIDVGELLKHIKFEGIEPKILEGGVKVENEKDYLIPIQEFGISRIHLKKGNNYSSTSYSLEIFLVMEGEVKVGGSIYSSGEAFLSLAGANYTIEVKTDARVFKAFVPRQGVS